MQQGHLYPCIGPYIGEALNSGAHLTGLIRIRVGDVRLEDCLSVESFPEWLDQQEIEEVINE